MVMVLKLGNKEWLLDKGQERTRPPNGGGEPIPCGCALSPLHVIGTLSGSPERSTGRDRRRTAKSSAHPFSPQTTEEFPEERDR